MGFNSGFKGLIEGSCVEIIGRNATNIVLMSSYDGLVAIIDIISVSEMHIIFMCLRRGLHHLCCFCFNKLVPAKKLLKFQREILYILSYLLTLYIFTEFCLYITALWGTFKS